MRLLLTLLLALIPLPTLAQPLARLDRDRIALGETVTLTVEVPSATAAPPDYRPLQRDFETSGHTSRRGVERSNGRFVAWTEYAVALRPRRAGTLVVPALAVAGSHTAPLTLRVDAGAAPAPVQAGAPIFIESGADDATPHVQQTVAWVVRLYSATPILSGQLDQPAPEGAALQRVGEDAMYTRDIGGRRYQVFERRYLLVPERSGTLAVPPARFQGRTAPGLFDDLFGRAGDAVSAQARPQRLQVQPLPADAPQPWLPLHALHLRHRTLPQQARVGEAATVVVEMSADGAGAAQLPELRLEAPAGAQVFPDPPQVTERLVDGRPQAVVSRRFAIVPGREGVLTVPGLRVPWWDVRADRTRVAALPALTLQVRGASRPAAAAGPVLSSSEPAPARPSHAPARGWILATLAFAALWLATLVWALQRRAAHAPREPARTDGAAPAPRATVSDLRRALDVGDFGDIEAALRALAPRAADDTDALIAQLADPAQRQAVDLLRRVRWAGEDALLARQQLRAAFAHGPRWSTPATAPPPLLPPLYPPG
ncbi:MAG: BatD family protein [Pseudomonadota bacterium]